VELDQLTTAVKMLDEDIDLFFEIGDIVAELALFGSKDYITAAEVTGTTAKRQVNIDGDLLGTIFEILDVLVIIKLLIKLQCRGVAGIARPWFGIFAEFF
jgi:hypothetical protein